MSTSVRLVQGQPIDRNHRDMLCEKDNMEKQATMGGKQASHLSVL
jgi:hypothetical protein